MSTLHRIPDIWLDMFPREANRRDHGDKGIEKRNGPGVYTVVGMSGVVGLSLVERGSVVKEKDQRLFTMGKSTFLTAQS